jgi:hypothetical protein
MIMNKIPNSGLDPVKIKPRTMPRDFMDVLIGLFVVLPVQVVPVFFLPSGLIWWLTGSFLLGFLTFIVIYTVWLCWTVWSLELSSDGIRFVRFCGAPKLLRWDEVTDISEAPRREIVLHGWLWPVFPAREMTPALSALCHFRICWRGGVSYFPPARADEFKRQIDEFRTKKRPNETQSV